MYLLPVQYWCSSCFHVGVLGFSFSSTLSMLSFTCVKSIYVLYIYIFISVLSFFFVVVRGICLDGAIIFSLIWRLRRGGETLCVCGC